METTLDSPSTGLLLSRILDAQITAHFSGTRVEFAETLAIEPRFIKNEAAILGTLVDALIGNDEKAIVRAQTVIDAVLHIIACRIATVEQDRANAIESYKNSKPAGYERIEAREFLKKDHELGQMLDELRENFAEVMRNANKHGFDVLGETLRERELVYHRLWPFSACTLADFAAIGRIKPAVF